MSAALNKEVNLLYEHLDVLVGEGLGVGCGKTSELPLAHVDLMVGTLRSLHELAGSTLITAFFKAIDLGNIVKVEDSSEGLELARTTVQPSWLETLGAVRDPSCFLKNAFLEQSGSGVFDCRLDHEFKLIIKIKVLITLKSHESAKILHFSCIAPSSTQLLILHVLFLTRFSLQ